MYVALFFRESIQFSTFSGTDIQKLSEVQVYQGKYYDDRRKPVAGGLLDPHMVMYFFLSCKVLSFRERFTCPFCMLDYKILESKSAYTSFSSLSIVCLSSYCNATSLT